MKYRAAFFAALIGLLAVPLGATPASAGPGTLIGPSCQVTLTNNGQTSCDFYAQVVTGVSPTFWGEVVASELGGEATATVSCTQGGATIAATGWASYTRAGLCKLTLTFRTAIGGGGPAGATASAR